MTPEQVESFLAWLKTQQTFHEGLASGKQAATAYGLNHQSRAVAFLDAATELRIRLARGGA